MHRLRSAAAHGRKPAGVHLRPIVRITAGHPGAPGTRTAVAVPHALPGTNQAPLTAVLPLVPKLLPPPRSETSDCRTPGTVTIAYASKRTVSYGPCLPDQIYWLGGAVLTEANLWAAKNASQTTIVGATPAEEAEVRELEAAFGKTPIQRIEFYPASEDPPTISNPTQQGVGWMVDWGTTLRGQWEAGLLAALYDAAAGEALRPVESVNNAMGGGPANLSGIGPPVGSLAAVRRLFPIDGATLVALHVIDGAVEVTIHAENPARFLKHDGPAFLNSLRGPNLGSSVYFAVEDHYGSVVYAGGWLPNVGMQQGRADLTDCGPVMVFFGVPANWPPQPPCLAT
jgi:hypothetical protein